MNDTSEINFKLEVMFDLQRKIMIEDNMQPDNLTPAQKFIYIEKCWRGAIESGSKIRKLTPREMFGEKQVSGMFDYIEMVSHVIDAGIYLGVDPKLLFNLYKFRNQEKRNGIHS